MNKKLFIPILLGTKRQGRASKNVANFILKKMKAHSEIDTQLFDVCELNIEGTEGQDLKKKNPEYRDAISKADGLVIIAPEYNHGYPGSLKIALDMLLKEYIHKVVGFCGVSSGGFGGARVIEALVSVVRELGLVATFTDVNFSKVESLFNEKGKLTEDRYNKKVDGFLEELIWMAKTMRWGRENLPSKFH